MSQAQASVADLQARKAIADAEKAAIDAEFAREESRKKLAESLAPADPGKQIQDARLDAAKSAKTLADAEKARSDAEAAAFKSRLGDVPSSAISGNVKVEQGAASFETALLAAQAAVTAGLAIAKAVAAAVAKSAPVVAQTTRKILVFADGEVPDFQATTAFLAQRSLVLQALADAVSQSEEAGKAQSAFAATESVAAVGVALEAVTRLLGFFKSDFEVRGSEVASDHVLLAKVVAGELLELSKPFEAIVFLKGTFNPTAVAAVGTLFKRDLESLNFQRAKAARALAEREHDLAALQSELAGITGDTPADNEKKAPLTEQRKHHQAAADRLKGALAAYDVLVGKLAAPDAGVAALIREYEVWNVLSEPSSLMLIVKMDKAGGSNYVEKNLWTTLGAMPFKVMGGVIASYTLFQGNAGQVLASGTVPVHGGFRVVSELGGLFK